MDEEVIIRRDGSVTVLMPRIVPRVGLLWKESTEILFGIEEAKDLEWLAIKCDALGRLIARTREAK